MRLTIGIVIGVLAKAAAAQTGQPVQIDPGHGDTSPNAVSLKRLDVDLRVPTAFGDVYKISTIDAFGAEQRTFIRMDGAITAEFPRSVYLPSLTGLAPDVPPGTVFYIGGRIEPPKPPTYISYTFLDHSVGAQTEPEPVLAAPVVGVGSLITDESYRHRRIEALMALAFER